MDSAKERERKRDEGGGGIAPKSDATPRCETESAARRSVRIYGRAEGHADRRGDRQTDGQTVGQTGLRDCVDCGMDKSVLRLAASKPLSQLVVVSIPSDGRRYLKEGRLGRVKVVKSWVRLKIEV